MSAREVNVSVVRGAVGAAPFAQVEHTYAKYCLFGLTRRLAFYRRMQKFCERGKPLNTAIGGMLARYERKKDPRKHIFGRIHRATVQEGESFVDAFRPYGSPAELMMISAGFAGDKAAEGFRMAAYVATSVREMRSAIIGKLFYPSVLIAFMVALVVGLSRQLVPIMRKIRPDESTWPGMSQALASVAYTIEHYGVLLGLLALVVAIMVTFSLSRWTGRIRVRVMDRWIPPWSMYCTFQAASFLIALGAMVRTGRPLASAIDGLAETARAWLRSHLLTMSTRVKAGDATWQALDTGMLDDETMGDLEDYSASGAIDEALMVLGEDAVSNALVRIRAAAAVLWVVALLLVAGGIVLIYGGFASFMYDLSGQQGPIT